MSDSFLLRAGTNSDFADIALVHMESINATFLDTIPDYATSRSLVDFEKLWRLKLSDAQCSTAVGLEAGRIVGFVTAGPARDLDLDRSCGEVDRIYLHPSAWRKGYGRRLLQWCEQRLRASRCTTATLWVFEVNVQARRFYEKAGYAFDGLSKEDFGARLLRYRKQIAGTMADST